ncbi:Gmad2 immunoglobulin-like domain-containing protein [Patescibacteria group bacterium]
MKDQKGLAYIGAVVAIVIIALSMIGVIYYFKSEYNKEVSNTNTPNTGGGPIITFNDCLDAGYPVAESYPRTCRTPEGETFIEVIGNELEKTDLIKLGSPRPGDIVTSPVLMAGDARGTWFFEGSFSVDIVDVEGNIIGQTVATAQRDWMTEDFVPFSATLEFDDTAYGPGELHLNKSNPSGLAENDDQLIVPVDFGPLAQ